MTAVSSSTSPERSVPLIECAPWCSAGDGHPDNFTPEDQWCSSVEERVNLGTDRYRALKYNDNTYRLDYMAVYVYRDAGAPCPLVDLSHNEEAGMKLSADEAEQLGKALIRAAATARR